MHPVSLGLSSELMHLVEPAAMLDLSVGDGTRAFLAVRNEKPYLGFVLTEEHKVWVEDFRLTTASLYVFVDAAARGGKQVLPGFGFM